MSQRVLLLSGGMDSTALAWALRPARALTINYGQRAFEGELRASRAVCAELSIAHEVVNVDCRQFGSGDLAGSAALSVAPIPEWWPYRNQLLATIAAMHVIRDGATELIFGTVRTDAAHADGRPEFIETLDALLRCQEGGISILAPAIGQSTVELVRSANVPLDLLHWAHSCHTGEWACGECRGCHKYTLVMNELVRGHQDNA